MPKSIDGRLLCELDLSKLIPALSVTLKDEDIEATSQKIDSLKEKKRLKKQLYRLEHRDYLNAQRSRYRREHREQENAYKREYRRRKQADKPLKSKPSLEERHQALLEYHREYNRKYYANKKNDPAFMEKRKEAKRRCLERKKAKAQAEVLQEGSSPSASDGGSRGGAES